MQNSPVLNRQNAREIFRNDALEKIFLELENPKNIVDESIELARLVNTGRSKNESFSRWVRYREGYSPAIVKRILDMFPINHTTEYLMDPMCGSGSSQVAAQQLGIPSAGSDVSPYAVLVSLVKTSKLTSAQVRGIELFAESLPQFGNKLNLEKNPTEVHLSQYFPPANFDQLITLKRTIFAAFPKKGKIQNFLLVALLAIVEDCSNRKKDGNGLATRPSSVTDASSLFKTQLREMLADLSTADWLKTPSIAFNRSALQIHESITEASSTFNKSLGAVIFSPPYANSFDYYESYKLELLFGDFFTLDSINVERKRLIRSYRQMGKSVEVSTLPTVELLIDEIMSRLPAKEALTGVKDGRSRLLPNMLRGYFEDMQTFLVNAAAEMPVGSYMAIVVDQSAYLGVLVPTDLILAEIAKNQGFAFEKLVICRRAKTSGQQMNMQPMLGEVLRESAVILRR